MLEGDASWNGLPGGADLGERVRSLVVGSRDAVELTTLKVAAHLLNQEAVAGRVGVPGIPITRELLHHQVQVATKDASDADLLGQPWAVDEGFVFRHVVGCGEVDLQRILQPVILGGI